jgi:hypothetical protein
MFKLYTEMPEQELEQTDLIKFTGLELKTRVTHANAGKHGGNGTIISAQNGTIIGHQNQGLHHWGGLCVTVLVKWDDGSTYELDYKLVKKC